MSSPDKPPEKKGFCSWTRRGVVRVVQWSSICNGFCLALCAICGFLLPSGPLSVSFSTVTLSGYIVFLGLLMCCIELNISLVQRKLRKSFGFMFSYAGRAAYIFFVGTMAVALGFGGGSSWLMYTIGAHFGMWTVRSYVQLTLARFAPSLPAGVTFANALFNFVVVAFHPAFKGIHAFDDPWNATATPAPGSKGRDGGGATSEREVLAYLASRPDLAAQAAGAVARVATQPQAHETGVVVAPNPLRGVGGGSAAPPAEDANPFK